MGKYFGTDGVRGIANKELTPELAYRLGRCGGYVLAGEVKRPKVLIGRDTRISGPMLESALVAGLLSIGADVIRVGVISTPGVAYLTRMINADAGVMISASHNPVGDNGIKFFGGDGFKLYDETELRIEQLMDQEQDDLPRPVGSEMGTVQDDVNLVWKYAEFLKGTVSKPLSGLKIVLDCANGAAYQIAPRVFREMGADVISLADEPNGLNINEQCGSTHPDHLQREVLRHGADIGLSFDGDADRLIAIDETGAEVDGDYILSICSVSLKEQGRLNSNTVVTTVMSNMGFYKAMEKHGIHTEQTAVGDRYVMEMMRKGGYNLGGEQSGHVIFLDHNTTGDGILTALQLCEALVLSGQRLSQVKELMSKFPQVLVNVKVADKTGWNENAAIAVAMEQVTERLGSRGRLLVRPSGTESLIRVMAEGEQIDEITKYVNEVAATIEQELGSVSD